MLIFQSTLPRRERPLLLILLRDGEHFNPRSHEGSDCTNSVPFFVYLCISIHAPARGATVLLRSHSFDCVLFQSTLPREERQSQITELQNIAKISIHAPARGATYTTEEPEPTSIISIHAPARGATNS